MAATVASSGIYALRDPKAVLTVMLIAIDEGSSLFEAVGDYYIIEGSVGVYSKALLRRFLDRGGEVKWKKDGSEGEVVLWGRANYLPGKPELEYKYTREMADAAHITTFWQRDPEKWRVDPVTKKKVQGKGWSLRTTWASYEPAMLRARALTGLFTMLAPDVFRGRKTVDQLEDTSPVEAEYSVVENGNGKPGGPTLKSAREIAQPEAEPEEPETPPEPEPEPKQAALTFDIKADV